MAKYYSYLYNNIYIYDIVEPKNTQQWQTYCKKFFKKPKFLEIWPFLGDFYEIFKIFFGEKIFRPMAN